MDTVQRSESLATLRAEKNYVFQLKMLSSPISTASQLSCVAWCHGTLLLSQDLSCSGTLPLPCQATRQRKVKRLCSVKELRWKRSLVRVWYETVLGRIETYHIMWYSLNATKTSHNWGWLEPFQPFIYSKFRDCLLGLRFTTLYWNHCIKFGQSLLKSALRLEVEARHGVA